MEEPLLEIKLDELEKEVMDRLWQTYEGSGPWIPISATVALHCLMTRHGIKSCGDTMAYNHLTGVLSLAPECIERF